MKPILKDFIFEKSHLKPILINLAENLYILGLLFEFLKNYQIFWVELKDFGKTHQGYGLRTMINCSWNGMKFTSKGFTTSVKKPASWVTSFKTHCNPKQNGTQQKAQFSGIVFCAVAQGLVGLVPSLSYRNSFLICSEPWLTELSNIIAKIHY